jgi:hypothetical protein
VQLAGGDAEERDQVVGLPEAVDVSLAEAGAAAQDTAPGGRVVDRDRGAQLGAGGPETALASRPRLAQVDATVAQASERGGDGGAGEPVP